MGTGAGAATSSGEPELGTRLEWGAPRAGARLGPSGQDSWGARLGWPRVRVRTGACVHGQGCAPGPKRPGARMRVRPGARARVRPGARGVDYTRAAPRTGRVPSAASAASPRNQGSRGAEPLAARGGGARDRAGCTVGATPCAHAHGGVARFRDPLGGWGLPLGRCVRTSVDELSEAGAGRAQGLRRGGPREAGTARAQGLRRGGPREAGAARAAGRRVAVRRALAARRGYAEGRGGRGGQQHHHPDEAHGLHRNAARKRRSERSRHAATTASA